MEINIVASREYIIDFVNDFMHQNNLIFFSDEGHGVRRELFGKKIYFWDFRGEDILINIGSSEDFNSKIKPLQHRPFADDKDDFIQLTSLWIRDETDIINTSFIWYPSRSANAKLHGSLLRKMIKKSLHFGMQTVDIRYHPMFRKTLRKYYYPLEVSGYLEILFERQKLRECFRTIRGL